MKKKLLLFATTFFFGMGLNAQTYSEWGLSATGSQYDTLVQSGDTLTFTFTGIPSGAWGDATLTAYFQEISAAHRNSLVPTSKARRQT